MNCINFNNLISPIYRPNKNQGLKAVFSNTYFSKLVDGFNPLDEIISHDEIIKTAYSNLNIKNILQKYNLPIKINMKELQKLKEGHLKNSRVLSAKIYSSLPKELKSQANNVDIQQAALLHDYGKVFIPEHILNKTGILNKQETEIMQLHSELGYELLKNKSLNDNILNLIKYHHQTPSGNGYPKLNKNFNSNSIDLQILSIADKYSALTENRPYKKALNKDDALKIIAMDVQNKITNPEIFLALKNIL